jgi:hypothetical protein
MGSDVRRVYCEYINFILLLLFGMQYFVASVFCFAQATAFRGCFRISTLFSPINSDVLHLNITGLSRNLLFTTLLERKSTPFLKNE